MRRVVTLFTEAYVHTTLKHGRLVEGGRVSMPLPQSCALLRAVDPRFPHSLDIFDFSERHVMRRAAEAPVCVCSHTHTYVCGGHGEAYGGAGVAAVWRSPLAAHTAYHTMYAAHALWRAGCMP